MGLFVIQRAAKDPRWKVEMPGSQPGRRRRERAQPEAAHPYAGSSTARVAAIFGVACLITLGAGVLLEVTGNDLANRLGVNGVIFGATVLATATALPEISSGIAAVRLGDNALAMGTSSAATPSRSACSSSPISSPGSPSSNRRGTSTHGSERSASR